jgi:hypothetical protein
MGINGWSMLHFAAKVGVLKFYRFLVKEARLGANSHSLQVIESQHRLLSQLVSCTT